MSERLARCGLKIRAEGCDSFPRGFMRMKRLRSWVPVLTVQGYIVLVREQVEPQDEIWIIGGSSVPILLSRDSEDPSHFRVKGEVFLDGFMFGEVRESASDIEEQCLQIRLI